MALAATLVGFGFLVIALVTGTVWLAVACIVVCVLGALLLLADTFGFGAALASRRRRRAEERSTSTADAGSETALSVDSEVSSADEVSDTEVTTEFPRIAGDEPVVTLDGPDRQWHTDIADSVAAGLSEGPVEEQVSPPTSRHGRHEERAHVAHAHAAPVDVPHSHHAHAHEASPDGPHPDRPQSDGPHPHSAPVASPPTGPTSPRRGRHGAPD